MSSGFRTSYNCGWIPKASVALFISSHCGGTLLLPMLSIIAIRAILGTISRIISTRLAVSSVTKGAQASNVPAWLRKANDHSGPYRLADRGHNDGYCRGGVF